MKGPIWFESSQILQKIKKQYKAIKEYIIKYSFFLCFFKKVLDFLDFLFYTIYIVGKTTITAYGLLSFPILKKHNRTNERDNF